MKHSLTILLIALQVFHASAMNEQLTDIKERKIAASQEVISASVPTVLSHLDEMLFKAVSDADITTADLALAHGANINAQDTSGKTPLQIAMLGIFKKTWGSQPLKDFTRNSITIALLLIKKGAQVNIKDTEENTPLIQAVLHKNKELISALIKVNADPFMRNKQNLSAFMLFAKDKELVADTQLSQLFNLHVESWKDFSKEIMRFAVPDCFGRREGDKGYLIRLLRRKNNVNFQDESGTTPLMWACHCPEGLSVVKYLIRENADLNIQNSSGMTALLIATKANHTLIIQQLINAHANVNLQDDGGQTALMYACRKGKNQIIALLLQAGADTSMKDHDGKTAHDHALEYYCMHREQSYQESVFAMLIEHDKKQKDGAKLDPKSLTASTETKRADEAKKAYTYHDIINAILEDATEKTSAMIKASDKSTLSCLQPRHAFTALMAAAYMGNQELAAIMLERGVDVDIQNEKGRTALMFASEYGYLALAEQLIRAGASIDLEDSSGLTALMMASRNGFSSLVELLVKANSDVNKRDKEGRTALTFACEEGHANVVKLLIEAKAHINYETNIITPLMAASFRGHIIIVEQLLKAGALIDLQTSYGRTALIFASLNLYSEAIVELLIKARANIDLQDHGGTALLRATSKGLEGTMALLLAAGADPSIKAADNDTAYNCAKKNAQLTAFLKTGRTEYLNKKLNDEVYSATNLPRGVAKIVSEYLSAAS